MNLITNALAALLAVAVITAGVFWAQLRSAKGQVVDLQKAVATVQADAALCTSATQELSAKSQALKERIQAAEQAARKAAKVKPLQTPPKAGDGCEKAASWAVEQAPALVRAWEGEQ